MAFSAGAQDFSVAVPSAFRTEVFVESKYDETFVPEQFMSTEVRFRDFQNYRMMSLSATTIKPELVENGLNLVCIEREIVVIEGKSLNIQRQSRAFQSDVPLSHAALEQMVKQRCGDLSWSVSYATSDKLQRSLGQLNGLGILIGSIECVDTDRCRFSFPEKNRPNALANPVTARVQTSTGLHQVTLTKWHEKWRIARVETKFSDVDMRGLQSVRELTNGLEAESSWSKTQESPESRAKSRMSEIEFSVQPIIALSHSISNGTQVTLKSSPQIRAVWMDGKVVRVYEGGTVDDLGSATFRTTSGSYGIEKILLITIAVAFLGGALMWICRSRNGLK